MDMRRTGGKEDSVAADGEGSDAETVANYDRKTGDGKWLEETLKIFREAIKEAEAVSTPEPQKSMREESGELASCLANGNQ